MTKVLERYAKCANSDKYPEKKNMLKFLRIQSEDKTNLMTCFQVSP